MWPHITSVPPLLARVTAYTFQKNIGIVRSVISGITYNSEVFLTPFI